MKKAASRGGLFLFVHPIVGDRSEGQHHGMDARIKSGHDEDGEFALRSIELLHSAAALVDSDTLLKQVALQRSISVSGRKSGKMKAPTDPCR
tara:strand:+ start:631 stop:906 length:276 start_codon:yes stop_codon:yes gene_type:complete